MWPITFKNRGYYYFLAYVYSITTYVFTNRYGLNHPKLLPLTPLDMAVPLMPWTAWIYISVYFIPLMAGVLVVEEKLIQPMVLSFLFLVTVCIAIFYTYPTTIIRPPLPLNSFPMDIVWKIDEPTNCCPSLHVGYAFLSAFFVNAASKKYGNIAIIWAILISISTLTIKQHYVWDVVAGYFAARIIFIAAMFAVKRQSATNPTASN